MDGLSRKKLVFANKIATSECLLSYSDTVWETHHKIFYGSL